MRKFDCPKCNGNSRIYSTDHRYEKRMNLILRYRRCDDCKAQFITKQICGEDKEHLVKILEAKSTLDLIKED